MPGLTAYDEIRQKMIEHHHGIADHGAYLKSDRVQEVIWNSDLIDLAHGWAHEANYSNED